MIPFEYMKPRHLDEAIEMLNAEDPSVRPISGGTAVMLMMKAGVLRPSRLVSLRYIEDEYRQVAISGTGELHIGGMATLSTLEHHRAIQQGWPVLAKAFRKLSNVRVRNVAMIGGNLAHADPHLDMPPVLSLLNARVEICGQAGRREMPVEELIRGYYETALAPDELITKVIVPPMAGRTAAYMKVTTRASHDWPTLGVAALVQHEQQRLRHVDLIVGAATDRPTRLANVAQSLVGIELSDYALREAGERAAHELDIVDDQHGSAEYKKHLLSVYLGRAIRSAVTDMH